MPLLMSYMLYWFDSECDKGFKSRSRYKCSTKSLDLDLGFFLFGYNKLFILIFYNKKIQITLIAIN